MFLREAIKSDYGQIKPLYRQAFPKEERAPFFLIKKKTLQGKSELLVAEDNGEFVGFAYMVCHEDLAYIFYLAIDENKRGKGYGSKILQELKTYYSGKRIFLAREQLDSSAPNYEQRLKRHEFYLKNGFEDLPYKLKEASVVYDIMGIGGTVTAAEYDALISGWAGTLMRKLIDMRIIE